MKANQDFEDIVCHGKKVEGEQLNHGSEGKVATRHDDQKGRESPREKIFLP